MWRDATRAAFRSMVRDDAHFYSPVGLESEGIFVDFQVGVNDYLYGTRFFSYLAQRYSPKQVVQWLRRDEGSEAYYQSQFRDVFGLRLNEGLSLETGHIDAERFTVRVRSALFMRAAEADDRDRAAG